jgi:hypothetical protein
VIISSQAIVHLNLTQKSNISDTFQPPLSGNDPSAKRWTLLECLLPESITSHRHYENLGLTLGFCSELIWLGSKKIFVMFSWCLGLMLFLKSV